MIKYQYGSCVPVSELTYKRLKQKGYNPILVAGYVKINNPDLYFSDNKWHKIQHTWLICNNHLIDITKNQFDIYGGIYEYMSDYYYKIKGNKFFIRKTLKALNKIK